MFLKADRSFFSPVSSDVKRQPRRIQGRSIALSPATGRRVFTKTRHHPNSEASNLTTESHFLFCSQNLELSPSFFNLMLCFGKFCDSILRHVFGPQLAMRPFT